MIFIIRAHQIVRANLDLAESVAEVLGRDRVAFALDERGGPLDVGSFRKISLTTELFETLGLYAPHDVTWRCGDYALYAARAQHPEAPSFLMVEGDVRFNHANLGVFLHRLAAAEADVVAPSVRPAPDWWHWTGWSRRQYAGQLFRCFFPVVWARGRALDQLYVKRRALSRIWSAATPELREEWLNDEAFVANETVRHGLRLVDLNDVIPESYTGETLRSPPALLDTHVSGLGPDNRIYHPVLSVEQFRAKRDAGQLDEAVLAYLREQGHDEF